MATPEEEQFLLKLAEKLGPEWTRLGTFLGVGFSRVKNLRVDHSADSGTAIQTMLDEWWKAEQKSKAERKKQLIAALRECGRADLAEDVSKWNIKVPPPTGRDTSDSSLNFPVQDSAGADTDGGRLPTAGTATMTARMETLTLQPSQETSTLSPPPAYPIRSKVGFALIINNIKFPTAGKGMNRKGMEKDSTDLERVLKTLGFSVKVKMDLNSDEMKDAIRKFINKNHSQSTCLLVSVMTHGLEQQAMGTDWVGSDIRKNIINPIVKSDNIACPKVFIMQMCRGGETDFGVQKRRWGVDGATAVDAQAMESPEATEDSETDSSSDEEASTESFQVDWAEVCSKLAPTDVDYIVTWASAEGRPAIRNRKQGSVLIQEVVKVFEQYGSEEDVATLFERVRGNVANVEATFKGRTTKQSAETRTQLLGKLYFKSSSSSA